jgi:starvation-inducible outer membrane lipoprotein
VHKLLCITFVLLLMGCATAPQKWVIEKRVVTRDSTGSVITIEDHYAPVVPFNFWSTLVDVAVGTGRKAGGL